MTITRDETRSAQAYVAGFVRMVLGQLGIKKGKANTSLGGQAASSSTHSLTTKSICNPEVFCRDFFSSNDEPIESTRADFTLSNGCNNMC